MKTAELTGPALDWAVAKCEGRNAIILKEFEGTNFYCYLLNKNGHRIGRFLPSTDWAQGGPIVEREKMAIGWDGTTWLAAMNASAVFGVEAAGATPLIAAMRCYVASKLGDEIAMPENMNELV